MDTRPCGCESGLRCAALTALWKGFCRYRGLDGYDLCRRLDIPILRSSTLERMNALLVSTKDSKSAFQIILPLEDQADMSAREGQLIFHELAHVTLMKEGPPFFSARAFDDTNLSRDSETWCDNFGLLMLLSVFGMQEPSEADGHRFFRQGEEAKDHSQRDRMLARRLRQHLFAAPRKPRWQRAPLLRLIAELRRGASDNPNAVRVDFGRVLVTPSYAPAREVEGKPGASSGLQT